MSTISVVDHVSEPITPDALFEYTSNPSRDPYLASKIDAERLLLEQKRSYDGELGPTFGLCLRYRQLRGLATTAPIFRQWHIPAYRQRTRSVSLIYADDIADYILVLLDTGMAGGYDGIHILANPIDYPSRPCSTSWLMASTYHVPARCRSGWRKWARGSGLAAHRRSKHVVRVATDRDSAIC